MRDEDIRSVLLQHIRENHRDSAVIEEMPLLRTGRADIGVVNCSLWGYEIKSERDTLNRLPQQIPFYDAIFDRSIVVVAGSHLRYVRKIVPSHWGIQRAILVDGVVELHHVRKPKLNTKTSSEALVRLVWKNEAVSILRAHGLGGSNGTPLLKVWEQLLRLPKQKLADSVRLALKVRNGCGSASRRVQDGDLRSIEPTPCSRQCLAGLMQLD
ncbi:sce7726 family protein [Planctomicrobium piriforme]